MRKLLLVIVLVLTGCSGGLTPASDSERLIQLTDRLQKVSIDAFVNDASTWIEKHFTATQTPVKSVDHLTGSLVGQGRVDYPCSGINCLNRGDWDVSFDMHLSLEGDTVVVTFNQINLISPSSSGQPGMIAPIWSKRDMDAVRPELISLYRRLVQYLNRPKR